MANTPGAVGCATVLRVAARRSDSRRERLLDVANGAAATVPVVATGPTGVEQCEPLVMATASGTTAFFTNPTQSVVQNAVTTLETGTVPTDGSDFVVEHDEATPALPIPDVGPLAVGRRRVLGPCGWVAPTTPGDYDFVSTTRDASDVKDLGLLGRGRGDAVADDPVAQAWEQTRNAVGESVVVVNAHETDHRPRADRTLLDSVPLSVLDGAAAIAGFVNATDVVIYVSEADEHLRERIHTAIENATDELPIHPRVVAGPDEYRAGAPTAALEAMEGADRIEPRLQPPPPAEYGLYGRPTVVHTPRTVAQVRYALADPEAFNSDAADPGTRLMTVIGDGTAPLTVELPPGERLGTVQEAIALEGRFKMACVGGPLGGITRDLDVAPTAQSLTSASLGTDGVVELLNEDHCVVATAGKRARFAQNENSGRCVPGREGTKQLTELLRDIYEGAFETDKIRELGRVMRRSANCQIGTHAPRPVITALDEFGPEFQAHAEGHCPSGTCTENL